MEKGTIALAGSLAIYFSIAVLVGWSSAATIDDVKFLSRVESYEAIVNTTLVTQEGKRIPIDKGMRVNVAGFTAAEAFILSRTDRPNGFIRKEDLAPLGRTTLPEPPRVKEQNIR